MGRVKPDHVENMIQKEAVNSSVGIARDTELVGAALAELLIQMTETFWLSGVIPCNGVGSQSRGALCVQLLNCA